MYENLVAFLLGKKSELSNEEMKEFMELICKAMNVTEEYHFLEKQSIIEHIIDSVDVKDRMEREVISDAIENILMFDESSSDYEIQEENLFEDRSESYEPLKSRKVKRGRFNKSKENLKIPENKAEDSPDLEVPESKDTAKETAKNRIDPSKIFKNGEFSESEEILNNKKLPKFEFEVSELQENQLEGPEFEFNLDEK